MGAWTDRQTVEALIEPYNKPFADCLPVSNYLLLFDQRLIQLFTIDNDICIIIIVYYLYIVNPLHKCVSFIYLNFLSSLKPCFLLVICYSLCINSLFLIILLLLPSKRNKLYQIIPQLLTTFYKQLGTKID